MTKHLNEEELNRHLIDLGDLPLEQQEHMAQCQKCQAEQEGFLSPLRQAQKILNQDQAKQYACRRRLWNSIDSPKSRFGLPVKLLLGATLCLLAGVLLLPQSPPLPVPDFTSQDQAQVTKESNSLLQFASLLAPDTEVPEPELLTFLQPEESEEEPFSDFILFIASPMQENS